MRTTEKVLLFRKDKRKRDFAEGALGGDKVKLVFFTLPTGEDLSSIMEETKEGGLPNMAVDDYDAVLIDQKETTPSSDNSGSRSPGTPTEVDQVNSNGSRASSVFTDLTEVSSSSASSTHAPPPITRLPSTTAFPQQAQPPPPPRAGRQHLLFKSSSSFQLSGYQGGSGLPGSRAPRPFGTLGGGCLCPHTSCHRFHQHHGPLSPGRHNHHPCGGSGQIPSSPPGHKMGHFQFGGQLGAQALQRQIQSGSPAHHQHTMGGSNSAFQPIGGQFQPPVRSASAVGLASMSGGSGFGCGCCGCCESRFCRNKMAMSSGNLHGSHEVLMVSERERHALEAPPPPPPHPAPPENSTPQALTAEGLSWRRLHMSRAKLKATATTSELLSGFAMVAMVELQINEPTNVPEWLFVLFAMCTTVLVSVHIFALMISTYILPNVDAVSKMQQQCSSTGESHGSYSHFSGGSFSSGTGPVPAVLESPHERMRTFIELAWAFSTVLGLFLFLVELAILCWVKFWDHSFTAAWAATVIVIPVLVLFLAFAAHFYHSLVAIKCDTSASDMRDLERMKADLDAVARDASAASNV
ncbi:uncharacterized protein LOC124156146 isoform X2 [Ischnura elegans]|uniref:uncharacterized protein LOC124156146 isoform X2 n=1 Tax=Ischnura elegans TaxID=197161 RepID=UPI001ED8ACEA|nr:uncharacterized protein LOC124156146 isoform X2 [Ischnura elegans]